MMLAQKQNEPVEAIADRAVIEAFFKAFATRDVQAFATFLHDDVVWSISGPVDVIPYCGVHRGKAAVIDVMARRAPQVVRVRHVVCEAFLVDGNRAAALTRLTARLTADGRIVSYRAANFFRFVDGKVIENATVLDSFDAAEQMLGHAIEVNDAPPLADGDLIAI